MMAKSTTKETACKVKRNETYHFSGKIVMQIEVLTNVISVKNNKATFQVETKISLKNGIGNKR